MVGMAARLLAATGRSTHQRQRENFPAVGSMAFVPWERATSQGALRLPRHKLLWSACFADLGAVLAPPHFEMSVACAEDRWGLQIPTYSSPLAVRMLWATLSEESATAQPPELVCTL